MRWFAESELFMCPCHGGVFYSDGRHASGPPPRPLYQYKYKVEAGQLWIYAGQLPTLGQPASMIDVLKSVWRWLDARLQIGSTIAEVAEHPVPRSSASWWYIFGSATLVVFILQVVTGICLATVYTPAADRAWDSLIYLNYQQPLGWYLRALHGWGSNFMVALMFIHMIQVFLFGAYKFPRELTWVAGCVLLLCTLGMAFTGQVLRFDQNAYWGLGHRRVDRRPHSDHRLQSRRSHPRRTDHRRRNPVALLRAACVRDPWSADRLRRPASLLSIAIRH